MLKIGITGGIGSGKTTVCKIFESLGIPVYYADDRAKWLMENDPKLVAGLKNMFGENVFDAGGKLNRTLIAQSVFGDEKKLAALNSLVHPAVFEDAAAWFAKQKNQPYALKEAALLVESGSYKELDRLIVATAPEKLRIERVVKRDGVSESAVKARIKNQLPESEKITHADFIINNDGRHSLVKQVWEIHQLLLKESAGLLT
ncbi:MAG TPA: dephospho-CoA kinase [Saprospiraceae bacterium]|nr:dephospho-CoA kinase [Saprospiraceae bacterium]